MLVVIEPAYNGEEFLGWDTVGRILRQVQECDVSFSVDDDVGAELTRVVATRNPDGLARGEGP